MRCYLRARMGTGLFPSDPALPTRLVTALRRFGRGVGHNLGPLHVRRKLIGKNLLCIANQLGHTAKALLILYANRTEDSRESDVEAIKRPDLNRTYIRRRAPSVGGAVFLSTCSSWNLASSNSRISFGNASWKERDSKSSRSASSNIEAGCASLHPSCRHISAGGVAASTWHSAYRICFRKSRLLRLPRLHLRRTLEAAQSNSRLPSHLGPRL